MKRTVTAGEARVGVAEDVLSVHGLGSCVAVILHDASVGVGGLAHVLLPDPSYSTTPERRWKFASTGVPDLLGEMERAGARRERIRAWLVGGASMFRELMDPGRRNIGERNVASAREALAAAGIRVLADDVGGACGRTVHFHVASGQVRISTPGREDVVLR